MPQSRTRLVLKEYSETDTKFYKSLSTGAIIEEQGKATNICASCRNAGRTGDSGRNSLMKPFLHGRPQPSKRSHFECVYNDSNDLHYVITHMIMNIMR